MTHVRLGDVEDGAAFENAGVVHQNLDIPGKCFPSISLACHVELFDREGDAARLRLALQGLDLCPDFNCGDDIESLLGQSHCSFVPESSSRARNQDLLHRGLLCVGSTLSTHHSACGTPGGGARFVREIADLSFRFEECATKWQHRVVQTSRGRCKKSREARASNTGSSSGVSFGKNNICEPRGLRSEERR